MQGFAGQHGNILEDFNADIAGFFMKYARGELREELKRKAGGIEVVYLDYDWSLNGK